MTNLAQTIGGRLELIRKREGLSKGAFAEFLGISRTCLHNYLKDDRDIPTSVLSKLLEKLSIDPLWMIQGDLSESAMQKKMHIFQQIKEIGLAIERRANRLDIQLTADERWRLLSQVYITTIAPNAEISTQQVTSDFFLNVVFGNNGYGEHF